MTHKEELTQLLTITKMRLAEKLQEIRILKQMEGREDDLKLVRQQYNTILSLKINGEKKLKELDNHG